MERAVRFAKRHRAVGIGVLGWHSYLQSNMIPFDSMEAMQENEQIFRTIREKSYEASEELADEFGEPEMLEGYGRRNTTTMSVAPTKSKQCHSGPSQSEHRATEVELLRPRRCEAEVDAEEPVP